MQRSLNVSTDVFAAIWAKRQDGEDSEDAILRRILGCGKISSPPPPSAVGGVRDARNGVTFPEGFETFRNYKSQEFRAVATGGNWVRRDTGDVYPTLNQLNASITAGAENVWNGNWKFRDATGAIKSIGILRR